VESKSFSNANSNLAAIIQCKDGQEKIHSLKDYFVVSELTEIVSKRAEIVLKD
jgi:hypothetical protein